MVVTDLPISQHQALAEARGLVETLTVVLFGQVKTLEIKMQTPGWALDSFLKLFEKARRERASIWKQEHLELYHHCHLANHVES